MICQFCRQWYIFSGDLSRKETVCLIELIEFYRTYPTYKNLIHILMQNIVTISQFTRSEYCYDFAIYAFRMLLRFRNLRVQISQIMQFVLYKSFRVRLFLKKQSLHRLIDWSLNLDLLPTLKIVLALATFIISGETFIPNERSKMCLRFPYISKGAVDNIKTYHSLRFYGFLKNRMLYCDYLFHVDLVSHR